MKTGDTEGNQTTQCSTQKVRFQCERDLSRDYLVKAKWKKCRNKNEMPEFTFTLTSWTLQDDLRKDFFSKIYKLTISIFSQKNYFLH